MPRSSARSSAPFVLNSEAIFAGQNRALHLLISGAPLAAVFEALVQTVETDLDHQAVGAILVLDPAGKHLRHGAAPSLPESYNRAIDGIAIGPDIGTCCAAAFRNEVVVTVDIENDPGWSRFKTLPLDLGLRAAWSMPIRSLGGRVLGTFGTYFRECRAPSKLECEIVGVLAKTAAVAIERHHTDSALRDSETFLRGVMRGSPDCIKVLDLQGHLQWMSENGLSAMEVEKMEIIRNADWLSFWPDAATRQQAAEALRVARQGGVGKFQGACPTLAGTPKWWDVVVTAIQDDDGKVRALLSVSRDVTERQKAEDALKRSEERHRVLAAELESCVTRRTAELAETNVRLRAQISRGKRTERVRQKLLQQLTSAEEDERGRISRELHDQVGQHLTAMMLGLKSLEPHLPAPALDKVKNLQEITAAVGKEVHALALKLRPTALDDLGLTEALAHYLAEWSSRTGVVVQYELSSPEMLRFPPVIETAIYRLVQEAVTNVAKHAQARRVTVLIGKCENHLLAIIEDDGKGFDPAKSLHGTTASRLGLRGMRERAASCGGTLNIESTRDYGTAVFVRIPLGDVGSINTRSGEARPHVPGNI